MSNSDLISQKEAAAILNRSISAISRAVKEGRLDYADPERRLFHRPGLEQRFASRTRPRVDAPQRKAQSAPMLHESSPAPIAKTYWERLDQKLQCVMDGSPVYWQRQPNPAQLRLFCRMLDELRSQVELEGLES